VEGFPEPILGLVVSVPEGGQPVLNRLTLREGRLVRAGADEVVLNEAFAEAHDLGPGDRLIAVIRGRRLTLDVVGVALSPEFLMQMQPGGLFPDPERYGVMWMGRERLAALQAVEGAFTDVAMTLAPGASTDDVLDRVDRVLDRYGGRG